MPLSEGTVTQVLISPDEQAIALSTKRGSVCIISLKPFIKLLLVSKEHYGEIVTCLSWNDKSTEIYVGDNHGKISKIALSIFAANTIVQTSSCALMNLDSSIIQTDCTSHYLLVSTLTRCYICDIFHEQFKQIGNKTRDGNYGACFFDQTYIANKRSVQSQEKDKKINKCNNPNDERILDQNIVIFCARPGCRLWEVTIDGIVVKTHEFKNALALASTKIFQSSNVHILNTSQQNEHIIGRKIPNFSRLYVIKQKYLITFTSKGLYIVDTVNAAIVLWTDQLKNISAVQTIDDKIYLLEKSGTFHCIVLNTVENLILNLYKVKMYNDCWRACMLLRPDLMNLSQAHINNIFKRTSLNDIALFLKSNFSNVPKILNSRTAVVNIKDSKFTTLLEHPNNVCEKYKFSKNCKLKHNSFEDTFCGTEIFMFGNVKYNNVKSVLKYLHKFTKSIEKHYVHILLINISYDILDKLLETFLFHNPSELIVGVCGCKNENAKVNELIVSASGKTLSFKISYIDFFKHIPHTLQYHLPIHLSKSYELDDIIDLCLDSKKYIMIIILLSIMNSQQWNIIKHYINKMRYESFIKWDHNNNSYLRNQSNMIDWSKSVFQIIKQSGTNRAMLNLRLIESHVSEKKVKKSIFKTLIFSKLLKYHGLGQEANLHHKNFFNKYSSVCFAKMKKLLVDALEKDLKRHVDDNNFGNGAYHWGFIYEGRTATCPCCFLALRTSVLLHNGLSIFSCGHAYHVNCLLQKKLTRCYLHY